MSDDRGRVGDGNMTGPANTSARTKATAEISQVSVWRASEGKWESVQRPQLGWRARFGRWLKARWA